MKPIVILFAASAIAFPSFAQSGFVMTEAEHRLMKEHTSRRFTDAQLRQMWKDSERVAASEKAAADKEERAYQAKLKSDQSKCSNDIVFATRNADFCSSITLPPIRQVREMRTAADIYSDKVLGGCKGITVKVQAEQAGCLPK